MVYKWFQMLLSLPVIAEYRSGTREEKGPLFQLGKATIFIAIPAFWIAACGASTAEVARPGNEMQNRASTPAGAGMGEKNLNDPSAPISERFATLDDYLAFLERTQAPVDGPWYRQVRPGIYELQTAGNLHLDGADARKQTFTREELERKFGFSK
jgi:hypothetical protein